MFNRLKHTKLRYVPNLERRLENGEYESQWSRNESPVAPAYADFDESGDAFVTRFTWRLAIALTVHGAAIVALVKLLP